MSEDTKDVDETTLSPADLVELLRSADPHDRSKALAAIFPGLSVSLVGVIDGRISMAAPETSNVTELFGAMVWASHKLGAALGVDLKWHQKAVDNDKIVVAKPGVAPEVMR